MSEENNKDTARKPWQSGEVPEYSRLCGQVLADIDILVPMLSDEARELFWRIRTAESRITELAVNESFDNGFCVACGMMREEMEEQSKLNE